MKSIDNQQYSKINELMMDEEFLHQLNNNVHRRIEFDDTNDKSIPHNTKTTKQK